MITENKKFTLYEWEKYFDTEVIDPDGWRSEKIDFNQKIDEDKFIELWRRSTCVMPKTDLFYNKIINWELKKGYREEKDAKIRGLKCSVCGVIRHEPFVEGDECPFCKNIGGVLEFYCGRYETIGGMKFAIE